MGVMPGASGINSKNISDDLLAEYEAGIDAEAELEAEEAAAEGKRWTHLRNKL